MVFLDKEVFKNDNGELLDSYYTEFDKLAKLPYGVPMNRFQRTNYYANVTFGRKIPLTNSPENYDKYFGSSKKYDNYLRICKKNIIAYEKKWNLARFQMYYLNDDQCITHLIREYNINPSNELTRNACILKLHDFVKKKYEQRHNEYTRALRDTPFTTKTPNEPLIDLSISRGGKYRKRKTSRARNTYRRRTYRYCRSRRRCIR